VASFLFGTWSEGIYQVINDVECFGFFFASDGDLLMLDDTRYGDFYYLCSIFKDLYT